MATKPRPNVDRKKPGAKRKPSTGGESAFTVKVGEQICDHIAEGNSLLTWTKGAGKGPKPRPSYRTIWNWLQNHESFKLAFDAAHKAGTHVDAELIRDLADGKQGKKIPLDRLRLMIDTRKWLLPKRNRSDFGDKIEVDANITLDDDQQIARLNDLITKSLGLEKKPEGEE